MISRVPTIQPIIHDGHIAAFVLAGHAIIEPSLSAEDLRHVEAMCLYALELADDSRAEPYTDAAADAYARAAFARA